MLTLNLTMSAMRAVLLIPSQVLKNEGATLTPSASAFILFVSLEAAIVRNVPQISTRSRCVSGGRPAGIDEKKHELMREGACEGNVDLCSHA